MPEGGVNEPARREPLRVNPGEWFSPLRGVASLPDTIRRVNVYRSKTVEMYVEGVGEMRLSLDSIDAGMLDVPMTVTLPEEDRVTDLSGALDLRRTIKNELFGIMFVADAKRFLGKELPFVVKMRTPQVGTHTEILFLKKMVSLPGVYLAAGMWKVRILRVLCF